MLSSLITDLLGTATRAALPTWQTALPAKEAVDNVRGSLAVVVL